MSFGALWEGLLPVDQAIGLEKRFGLAFFEWPMSWEAISAVVSEIRSSLSESCFFRAELLPSSAAALTCQTETWPS